MSEVRSGCSLISATDEQWLTPADASTKVGAMVSTSSLGFVLSGGAARGAYEAGVLRFVLIDLARRLGRPTWPDVVSGTSVGALNGVFAAARDARGLSALCDTWQRMRIEDVYRMKAGKVMRDFVLSAGAGTFALLDPSPFHGLVARQFPGVALRRAIGSGETRSFIVAATEVATGFNAIFVDSNEALPIADERGSRVYRTVMGGVHCRASAAIPFVFPAVEINGRYHVDGGLRQNTPLKPVLAAGVTRALIVGVKQDREEEALGRRALARRGNEPSGPPKRPSLFFLAGKMLNALLLDPIERDLWSAEYRNHVVDWGIERFGPGFAAEAREGLGLRKIDIVHLRPSEDLGELAGRMYRAHPPKTSRAVRFMLDRVLAYTDDIEADLLSYLYFDREYTGALESLGYEDARRHEGELARLYEVQDSEIEKATAS